MTRILHLVLIAFMILLSSCSKDLNEHDLEETEEISINEDEIYGNFRLNDEQVIIETEGLLYPQLYVREGEIGVYGFSTNEESLEIHRYDDKKYRCIGVKKLFVGQGPGDVGTAPDISCFNDEIYIVDHTQQRVSLFDENFNFIRFRTPTGSKPKMIDNGNAFLSLTPIAPNKRGKETAIFGFSLTTLQDMKKTILHKYKTLIYEKDKKGRAIIANNDEFFYFLRDNKMFFINLGKYIISQFSYSGELLKRIKVNCPLVKAGEKDKQKWIDETTPMKYRNRWTYPEYIAPCANVIPVDKGFIVLRRKDYSQYCKGTLRGDYFDYELNYLGRVDTPCFYWAQAEHRRHLSYYYAKGTLLTLHQRSEADCAYIVKKWKIEE